MPTSRSFDVRVRVLAAVAQGQSRRAAGERFGVSGDCVSFIISDNYQGAHGVGEALAAALKDKGWTDGSNGLVTISQARKDTILAVLEATPDIAIEQLRGALQGEGLVFG
jgi:ABC-type sugar transport system substrate-binding protein